MPTELELVFAGELKLEALAELCRSCRVMSEQSDDLYFDQEEAGEPEALWSVSFHKARAYAALAEFCEGREPQLDEVLYEALQSHADPDRLVAPYIELLKS